MARKPAAEPASEPAAPAEKPARRPRRSSHELDAQIVPGSLAERMLGLMRERGISAKTLSLRAGLSGDGVRSLLRGRIASPRAQSLVQLATALGVSVDTLTGGVVTAPEAVRQAAANAPDVLDVEVPEIDLRARSGVTYDGEIAKNPRRRVWRVPQDLLDERGLPLDGLAVVRVSGGEEGYGPTDRLLVDTRARRPVGGALLVVHDAGEAHTLVRVRPGYVHGRGAATYSGADEGARPVDEVVGTVLARWSWL